MKRIRPVGMMRHEDRLDDATELLSGQVIGAAIEVHRVLGPGLPEAGYERAMCLELAARDIPFVCQHAVSIEYRGHPVAEGRLDLLVADRIVVELKAVETLLPIHGVQLLSYLRITGHPLGLLINFNVTALRDGIKRIIHSR